MEKLFELFYQCQGISTDTRKIKKNSLFICLSGANFDGNEFAQKAIELGAKFVIADDATVCNDKNIFHVTNTLEFLQKLANYHRKKFSIPIIGITGSNGKTTTKELMKHVLDIQYNVLATEGNLNNHIGVPLTLLNLNKNHEIAIIEMGANKFKDIEELCQIAEPTIGIITNIGKAHLEGFHNFQGVLKTKKELYDSIEKSKGILFFNSDDEVLSDIIPKNIETMSFGTSEKAQIRGNLIEMTPFIKMKWQNNTFNSPEIQTALLGKYNFYNFLAAISMGVYFKIDHIKICKALSTFESNNNRSQIKKTEHNTLILDAYNANPSSMKLALESFQMIQKKNKVAILGDMFELGKESKHEHEEIIKLCANFDFECYFIGTNFYSHKTYSNQSLLFFDNKEEFINQLPKFKLNSKLILLKGSRGIGLEALEEKN